MGPIPGRGRPGRGRKGEPLPPTAAEDPSAPTLARRPALRRLQLRSPCSPAPAPRGAPGTAYRRRWRGIWSWTRACSSGHSASRAHAVSLSAISRAETISTEPVSALWGRCRAGWDRWLLPPPGELLPGRSEPLQQLGSSAPVQTVILCTWSSVSSHFHSSVRGIRSSLCRPGHSPRQLSACLTQDHTPGNARSRERTVVRTHVHTHHPAAQILSGFSVYP